MDEIITEQADVRLHELYVPEDQAQHSDLLHISLCKALYELDTLRARVAVLEKENKILETIARGCLGTLFAETYLSELRRMAKEG